MVFKDGIEGETPKPKKYKKHDHHHHKEKKIKRESGFNEDLDESLMMASSIKREDLDSNPAGVSEASKAALKKLLDLLLQQLQKKDTDGHFARPADPALFPGIDVPLKCHSDFLFSRTGTGTRRPGPDEKLTVNSPNTPFYPGPNLGLNKELFGWLD